MQKDFVYKKINIINIICFIFDFLFVLIISIDSSTTMFHVMDDRYWIFKKNVHETMRNMLFVLMIGYLIIYFFNNRCDFIKKIILIIILYGVIKLFIILNPYNVKYFNQSFIKPFICCVVIMVFGELCSRFNQIFKIHARIVFVISIISLFFYLAGPILNIIKGDLFYFWNHGRQEGESFYNLFFVNYIQNRKFLGIDVVRNVGVYMEAPGFAFSLTFALWWELFGESKKSFVRSGIVVVTMLTTFSMKAYLALFVITLIKIIEHLKKRNIYTKEEKRRFFFSALVVSMLVIIIAIKNVDFLSKMGSVSWRLEDTFAAVRTFFDFPFLGCGFWNEEILVLHHNWAEIYGGTAGLFNVFAYGGLFLGLFYFVPLIYPLLNKKISLKYKSFFALFDMFLLMSSFQFSIFVFFAVSIGYVLIYEYIVIKIGKYKMKYMIDGV